MPYFFTSVDVEQHFLYASFDFVQLTLAFVTPLLLLPVRFLLR